MCDKCGYQTKYSAHFNRHRLLHEKREQLSQLQIEKAFKCSKCDKQYDSRSGLRFHETKVHKHVPRKIAKLVRKCPLCAFESSAVLPKEMLNHFEQTHHVAMHWEEHLFATHNEFLVWKKEIESKSSCFYVKRKVPEQKLKVFTFKCHRSGFFEGRKGNQRRMKAAGSCKINGFCPSFMKATMQPKGVEVTYLATHVGHENDLKFLPLPDEDKLNIINQLKNNVPVNKILEDINKSLSNGEQMKRIHLLKPKDIINLTTQFKLKTTKGRQRRQPDTINIESYLEEIESSNDTSLLIYKGQGVVNEELPHLSEEDFLLIYMTSQQKSLLSQCIDKTICVHSNHLFSLRGSFEFNIVSLFALNDSKDGFPVAFMITNRQDEEVLATFFDEVKQVAGLIKCEVLMTDLRDESYLAWQRIMGKPTSRVFCSWNVLKDWRESINRRIEDSEKQEITFNKLQTLLREQDEDEAMKIISTLLTLEDGEEMKSFVNYFKKEFILKRPLSSWAYCSGKNAEINKSMMFDEFFRSLKFTYLKAKKNQSLDETMCAFLRTIKRRLHDYAVDMKLTKLRKKLLNTNKYHRQSSKKSFKIVNIDRYCWIVMSSSSVINCWAVQRISNNCYNCQLQCLRCNTCIHEFMCSCNNYAMDNNMCEHIHIVAQAAVITPEPKERPEDVIECDTVMMDFEDFDNNGTENDKILLHEGNTSVLVIKEEEFFLDEGEDWGTDEMCLVSTDESKTSDPTSSSLKNEKSEFIEEINKFLRKNVSSKEELESFKKEVKCVMGSKPKESTTPTESTSCDLPFQLTPGRPVYVLKLPPTKTTDRGYYEDKN